MRLLAICVALLLHINHHATDENLRKIVDNLSVLARVTNGISLQENVLVNAQKRGDFASRLLGAAPGVSLTTITQMQPGLLSNKLNSFVETLNALPALVVGDLTNLNSAVEKLDMMKDGLADILKVQQANVTAEYIELVENVTWYCYFPNNMWRKIQKTIYLNEALDVVQNITVTNASQLVPLDKALENVHYFTPRLSEMLLFLKNHTMWTLLYDFIGKNEEVKRVMKVSRIAEEYLKNMQTFVELPGKLDQVKSLVNGLSGIASDHKSMELLGSGLEGLVAQLNTSGSTGTSTTGFANGISDLEMIMKDVKSSDWVKKVLAGGKDTNKLLTHLNPLEKFTEGMRRLETSWRNITDPAAVKTLGSLATALREAADSGKVAAGKDLLASIATVQTCITGLLPVTNSPDFQGFEKYYNFTVELDATIIKMMPLLKELSELDYLDRLISAVKEIERQTRNYTSLDAGTVYRSLRAFPDFNWAVRMAKNITAVLTPYKEFAYELFTRPKWTSIEGISETLVNTTLPKALKCIQDTTFDLQNIDKVLDFEKVTTKLKKETQEFERMKQLIEKTSEMKAEFEKVVKMSRRKRRKTKPPILVNSQKAAQDLNKGVSLLGELEKVRKEGKKVTSVAKSDSGTDVMIRGMVGMASVWTDENKQKMLDLVKAVEDLNVKCANYSDQDIVQLGHVFDDAARIQGVQVDSQLFNDPVFKTLSAAKHPLAPDFLTVSHLNLNFASHGLDFVSAKDVLSGIQDFFDQFFGTVRAKKKPIVAGSILTSTEPSEFPTAVVVISLAVLLSVIIIGVVGWFLYKKSMKKDPLYWYRLLRSEETVEEMGVLYSRYLLFQEVKFKSINEKHKTLIDAVDAGDLESAASFISQGACINALMNNSTCLQVAVEAANLELVKLLVENGADRKVLNENYLDVNGYLAEEMKDETKKERKQKLSQITAYLDSVKDEKFPRKIPHLLPCKDFRIFIMASCEKTQFFKRFPNLVTSEMDSATHIVVPTDKDGVYEPPIGDPIETIRTLFGCAMVMKESWLKACLKSKRDMRNDYKFRVEKVRYKDATYDTLVTWHKSIHLQEIPFLSDVQCYYSKPEDSVAENVLTCLGVTWHKTLPNLSEYNHKLAHPWNHFDKPLMWAIHPTPDKQFVQNVEDYYQLSLDELIIILLKRETIFDSKKQPRYPVKKREKDPEQPSKEKIRIVEQEKLGYDAAQ